MNTPLVQTLLANPWPVLGSLPWQPWPNLDCKLIVALANLGHTLATLVTAAEAVGLPWHRPTLMQPCAHLSITCVSMFALLLHCIALHCTALHCFALHCIALLCTALHCIALH
jgi:hypothetical protein